MAEYEFVLFDTPIGRCGIVWSELGVASLSLPEGKDVATRARLLRRFPEAVPGTPPGSVRAALEQIDALLNGQASDLARIELDMRLVPAFHQRVYDAARAIA